MRTLVGLASILVAAFATAVLTGTVTSPPAPERRIVVAELFTSEGCSSCPPADRLLQQIVSTSPVDGVDVLGLEEHVDYWDHLGWRDPFSSASLTRRQSEYGSHVFRTSEIYTPQLVIDGAFETIGSDRAGVRRAIAAASGRPGADVRVRASRAANGVRTEIAVEVPNAVERHGDAVVMVAIAEDGLTSRVGRGENSGRTLTHSAVVRSLTSAGAVPRNTATRMLTAELPLGAEWRVDQLRVIAFVQERNSLRILGAAAATVAGQQ